MNCECPYPKDKLPDDWFKCDHIQPCTHIVNPDNVWLFGWKMCNECCGLYHNRNLSHQWDEYFRLEYLLSDWCSELNAQLI